MRLLIVYDETERETVDDARVVANLVQRALNTVRRELGIKPVHIQIVQEDDLA